MAVVSAAIDVIVWRVTVDRGRHAAIEDGTDERLNASLVAISAGQRPLGILLLDRLCAVDQFLPSFQSLRDGWI